MSEFEISAAILTAAVIAKSELTGEELVKYTIEIHRRFVRQITISSDADAATRK